MLFHTDGNLYVSSGNTNEVIRFNGVTGRYMNVFVQRRGRWTHESVRFDVRRRWQTVRGQLSSDSVLRYDGTTGFFDQEFVPSGSGGLDGPPNLGLRFGPDGHLYVASANSDRVIRYHRQSGAVLDAYVPPNADSLLSPWGLLFSGDGKLYVNSLETIACSSTTRTAVPAWQWQAELPLAGDVRAATSRGRRGGD